MCIKDIRPDLCDKEDDCSNCKYKKMRIGFILGDWNLKLF